MLEIKDLHVEVDGKQIINGLSLDGRGGRGACHHGPERLGQEHARLRAGRPRGLRGHRRQRDATMARTCWRWTPEERAAAGVFLAMQYPVEIPGVANMYFLRQAMNALRRARGEAGDRRRRVHEAAARQGQGGRRRPRSCSSATSISASRAARRSATRSCRWRCSSRAWRSSTRPIPASTSTRCARWPTASTRCATRRAAIIVITHYQRLLDYIVPDQVHVLADGRIERSGGKELALELEEGGLCRRARRRVRRAARRSLTAMTAA